MIERYALPEMSEIWTEKAKLDLWLEVELAACEAWTELGEIPAGSDGAPSTGDVRRSAGCRDSCPYPSRHDCLYESRF